MHRVEAVCLILSVCFACSYCGYIWDAKTLYTDIFNGYNSNIIPVLDQDTNITVKVTLYLISLKDFNEISGTLTIVAAFVINWVDASLLWDPAMYGGVSELIIGQSNVWLPKLYNIKVADQFQAISNPDVLVRIFADGQIYWQPGLLLGVQCNPDVSYFPFDTQICSVQLTAWGYPETKVIVEHEHAFIRTDFYETNGEWHLDSTTTNSFTLSDFRVAAFNVTISRLPAYHVVNTLLPIFLLLFMNPLVFLLPCESGERVGFSLTVFLSFAVFITIINATLPSNSDQMSRLSYFVFSVLCLSGLISAINVAQERMFYRDENTPIPGCLKKVVQLMTGRLCKCENTKKDAVVGYVENGEKVDGMETSRQIGNFMTAEPEVEITWQEVTRVLDKIYACLLYIAITVGTIVVTTSIYTGK